MTDSDDDWFEKDLDEFVVKTPSSNVEHITVKKNVNKKENDVVTSPTAYFDSEYGGNYYTSTHSKTQDQTKKTQSNAAFVQPISFKKLSYILEQSSVNIFLDIIQPDSGFVETLNRSTISTETIILTIKIILKCTEMPFNENIRNLLEDVVKADTYWNQLAAVLKDSTTPSATDTNAKSKSKKKAVVHKFDQEIWSSTYNLCFSLTKRKNITVIDDFLKKVISIIDENKNEDLNLNQFKLSFGQLLKDIEANSAVVTKDHQYLDIYPTIDELKNDHPDYVKPNIVKGRFNSVDHYLEVQMALLREDFVAPLRDGISQIMSDAEKGLDLKSNSFVRVYPGVRIMIKQRENVNSKNIFKNEYLMADLEAPHRNETGYECDNASHTKYSKKLMYGSLLCFTTSTKFDDLLLAIVSNRDVDFLNLGYIEIEIIKSYNITSIFEKDFILCESEVYFESYRHVYNVLRNFTEETFPMRNYIINIDSTHKYPNYVPNKGKICYTYKQQSLDIKETSTWPSAAALRLNESQLDALKHSLTHRFSVIQGPPGCGKTFIGLEIVYALLMNTDAQILIVCYTNHALDQFLSGISKYTEDIVRVGNQSKNESLDRFNLKQLTDNAITDKRVKGTLFKLKMAFAETVQKFNELQKKLMNSTTDENVITEYTELQSKLQSTSRMQEEIKQVGEYQLIKSKRVIGMTSTCAARCNSLMQLLGTPIVIFEEAAEILESHIVAALTKNVQHLILIGDHQQLRPTTSVYKLAQMYHMDISLFERMLNNNVNCATLTTQYRMRPEIANLIRPTIYAQLLDSEKVQSYPDVIGCDHNLFFIDHENLESMECEETTKKNVYESQYMVALCNYFLQQGYLPEDITILTPYNGQIYQLAQDRKKYPNLKKVRITSVDNFQGEDNKIILLTLVRSNLNNNIGYLAFKNRICVALSRAKEGFFIIGNMNCLSKASNIWKKILGELQTQEAIGTELTLVCSAHQNKYKIKDPSDFDEYGGCKSVCNASLPCGHLCASLCHTTMYNHFTDCQCNC